MKKFPLRGVGDQPPVPWIRHCVTIRFFFTHEQIFYTVHWKSGVNISICMLKLIDLLLMFCMIYKKIFLILWYKITLKSVKSRNKKLNLAFFWYIELYTNVRKRTYACVREAVLLFNWYICQYVGQHTRSISNFQYVKFNSQYVHNAIC
jgi:hypothetical protein